MQATLKNPIPEFNPITIELTFETLEEVKFYDMLMQANLRIPEMFIKDGDLKDTRAMAKLMGEMRQPIYKALNGKDYLYQNPL